MHSALCQVEQQISIYFIHLARSFFGSVLHTRDEAEASAEANVQLQREGSRPVNGSKRPSRSGSLNLDLPTCEDQLPQSSENRAALPMEGRFGSSSALIIES